MDRDQLEKFGRQLMAELGISDNITPFAILRPERMHDRGTQLADVAKSRIMAGGEPGDLPLRADLWLIAAQICHRLQPPANPPQLPKCSKCGVLLSDISCPECFGTDESA